MSPATDLKQACARACALLNTATVIYLKALAFIVPVCGLYIGLLYLHEPVG